MPYIAIFSFNPFEKMLLIYVVLIKDLGKLLGQLNFMVGDNFANANGGHCYTFGWKFTSLSNCSYWWGSCSFVYTLEVREQG